MKLTIKNLDQRNFQVDTVGVKTIWDLKQKLFNTAITNLLPERQQLLYAGRVLKDYKFLSHYSIDGRKFLLLMGRKNAKASNVNEQDKTTIKSKTKTKKRQPDKKSQQKPNLGQGDQFDVVCNGATKTEPERRNVNTNQVKGSKVATTVTAKKYAKIKQAKEAVKQAPMKKNKGKLHKSATSSNTSSQQEYYDNKQRQISSSSSGSHRLKQRQCILKRSEGKPIYKNKSARSTMSLLSTSRSFARKKVNKISANKRAAMKKRIKQKECDELVLRQIVAMGYNEDDVRRALIASFNNPNEAVDYLIQQVQERIEQQSKSKMPQQQQQKPKHCKIIEPVKRKRVNELAFLRHDPDFKNLRRLLRSRPKILQSVIKRIGATHPELLYLLKEHEDDFLQLLHESSVDSDSGDGSNSNYPSMYISPEEEKIIARLVRMGFKRQKVILAFVACDRNVEKAVDYLCQISDNHI